MRKVVLILSIALFLAVTCTITLAGVVPGALLHLDASDNPKHPDGWKNLGTAGGELPAGDKTPELERGTIKIPDLGFTLQDTKFYTCKESLQTFGGPAGTNPELRLESWTFEALCKRNGDVLFKEHWMFGLSLTTWGGGFAGFLGAGRQKGGELFTTRPVRHKSHGINLELGKWTWIAFMSDKSGSVFYQDGKEVDRDGPYVFPKALPVKFICIFCGHYGDLDKPEEGRARSFNGSFAVVRIYDKVLSANEIMGNISSQTVAVDPASKLTTAWGTLKTAAHRNQAE